MTLSPGASDGTGLVPAVGLAGGIAPRRLATTLAAARYSCHL
ncbi:MAG: hypothetical protein WKF82_06740 [Nocardioidaceae bacterium]